MNAISKLTFTAAVTGSIGVSVTTAAYAGSQLNGPQRTGMALQSLEASQPVVTAVRLPSGQTIDFSRHAAD
jgi:hypothetical protein